MRKQSKDMALKKVFEKNEYFASVFNNLLFNGEEVIKPDSLTDDNPEIVMDTGGQLSKRQRDLLKNAVYKKDDKINYLLLGIENQTTIDKNMVFRVMEYDVNTYMRQLDVEKENKNGKIKLLKPVITLVIYYGKRKWNAPLDIYTRIDIEEELKGIINNYKINLLCPLELTDDEINKYVKNIKFLFTYLKYSDEKEEIKNKIANNSEYKKIDNNIVNAVNILTDSNIEYSMEEEEVDMCKAIKDIRDEGKQEGIQEEHARMCKAIKDIRDEGKQEGIQEGKLEEKENNIKLMSNNGFDVETIARALSLDISYVKMVLSK